MKKIYVFLTLAFLFGQLVWAAPKPQKQSIVILYENDVHCAIHGYQVLAGLRDATADTAFVAVVSSGDFVQGGAAGALSRGKYVADIMREVNYDVITLGNHEFDYPIAHSADLLKYIGAPVVSANLYKAGCRKSVYAPFVIKKFGKTKIAFVGATTPTALYTETAAFMNGDEQIYNLREKDFFDVLQRTVLQARRKGAKYVIVLSHLGEDPNQTGVDSHQLIRRTTGIDVVLDGHTHSVVAQDTMHNAAGLPVIITETGTKFANIGRLIIRNGKLSTELVPVNTLSERNERVKWVTDSIEYLMREQTQRVVCHSDVALHILNAAGKQEVRMAETNAGDIICDAYRIISGADIALANGGGIRTEKVAGDLTYGDITDMLPYDNNLWVVEASGATIIDLLRRSTSSLPLEDGSFPQVSGLRFTARVADHSISDVEVLNKTTGEYEPIDPDRIYTVGTIDYCVTGGGFYDMLKNCKVIERGDVLYRDIFVEFLEKNLGGHISTDYAEPQGRIKIIK
jgi:2',3'-cyclic-nucleotide 2'-phosphodiesterase (5'-nucleotidase family)